MSSALERQVGGSHYVNKGIQPVEFWAANMWDGFSCSILKYMTRWKEKNGVQDLEKALHFAQLRIDCDGAIPYPVIRDAARTIKMGDFVKRNGIPADEDVLFYALEQWVQEGRTKNSRRFGKQFTRLLSTFIERQKALG